MVGLPCLAQPQPNIRQIRRKVQAGQPLTPEERQVLQRVNAQLLEVHKQYGKEHPPQSSFGLTALTSWLRQIQGRRRRSVSGRKERVPGRASRAGVKLARQAAPIDGKIVLLATGISNPNIGFPAFQRLVSGGSESVAVVEALRTTPMT